MQLITTAQEKSAPVVTKPLIRLYKEMEYDFKNIEKKWQQKWVENKTYQVTENTDRKKFYVLNMFPYPSGAGLHVGHRF